MTCNLASSTAARPIATRPGLRGARLLRPAGSRTRCKTSLTRGRDGPAGFTATKTSGSRAGGNTSARHFRRGGTAGSHPCIKHAASRSMRTTEGSPDRDGSKLPLGKCADADEVNRTQVPRIGPWVHGSRLTDRSEMTKGQVGRDAGHAGPQRVSRLAYKNRPPCSRPSQRGHAPAATTVLGS